MQSAAVPCTSNGIKRTAANALDSNSSSSTSCSSETSSKAENTNHRARNAAFKPNEESPPPPEKRSFIVIESPLKLETIASAEDLDTKVLRIQNKNLSERLVQRQKLEAELKDKIDALQSRKIADDNKLCIIDRYWTQLDEDMRLILERFDATEKLNESNTDSKSGSKQTSSNNNNNKDGKLGSNSSQASKFLAKLNEWDKVELEENLKERVKFTTQTVAKLITNYERITKRIEQYYKELSQVKGDHHATANVANLDARTQELYEENCRLNELVSKCQQKAHKFGLERKAMEDQIAKLENDLNDLTSRNDETEYELEKTRDKAFKLDRQLADTLVKQKQLLSNPQSNQSNANSSTQQQSDQNGHSNNNNNNNNKFNHQTSRSNDSKIDKQLSDLEADLEEQRELAKSRLVELEKLNADYQASIKQVEKLKADLKQMPESLIEQSSEYKILQTKYSLVVNDNIKLKQALDESKTLLDMSRATFQRQLEHMESEEIAQQKKLGNEMMLLEEQLELLKKENELLRIEFEQNVAANDQTGPINKEMRNLITTLQTNNRLLKSENQRTKKRLEEITLECEKLKKQIAHLQQQQQQQAKKDDSSESTSKTSDDEQLKDLKDQIRKLSESNKELKTQLDKLKQPQTSPATPSTPQSSQKSSANNELDDAKREIKRLREQLKLNHHHHDHSEHSHLTTSDYIKKIKSLEETIKELNKHLSSKKQEETALLNDMEITGQAFEDMQEQNIRLMQQLREKDDANFKLVSERIKLEKQQKILAEEKEVYVQQVSTLQAQLDTQMLVSKKLEDQFQALNQTVTLNEKDIAHLQQACENYKRQSIDNVQMIHDLKLNTQKYLTQLKEAQQQIAEKSEALASQTFLNKRSQEEIKHLQAKLERQKKFEMASSMDEVLMEEIKEYKEQLRCPSCKVKQKDAVLTKCFHVFCYDCLQKRLDTRQRKCPKCNAGFGVNDFRKLYLS